MDGELPFFGVKLTVLQGAVAGGIVAAIISKDAPLWRRLTNGVVGMLTAVYGTPLVAAVTHRFIEAPPELERALSFGMGLVGMHICEAILIAAARARNRAPEVMDHVIDTKLGGGDKPAP